MTLFKCQTETNVGFINPDALDAMGYMASGEIGVVSGVQFQSERTTIGSGETL